MLCDYWNIKKSMQSVLITICRMAQDWIYS